MGKLTAAISTAALIIAIAAPSAVFAEPTGSTAKKTTAKKTTTTKTAKPAEKKPAESTPAQSQTRYTQAEREEILTQVKKKYVCISNNQYLYNAEAAGAICPDGQKVLDYANRMIDSNWMRSDIVGFVDMLKMGRPLVEPLAGPACTTAGRLKNEFFIMSYCPYGVRYVTDALTPMTNDLGDTVDYMPYYIVGEGPDGKLASLHGQKELDENFRQICIREKFGIKAWKAYFDCFATEIFNNKTAPKDWAFCAEQAKLDKNKIEACASTEAPEMIKKDMELSDKYGAQASPTAVYNCSGKVVGAMPFKNVKAEICNLITGPKPAGCTK